MKRLKENKLTKRLNAIFGDNIALQAIYKQFLKGRLFLTGNAKGFSAQGSAVTSRKL